MPSAMKAVRLTAVGQPLEIQEIPRPAVGPLDVLVQVRAAGICHSDAHYRAGVSPVHPLPMTLGHEVSGVVAQVGELVTGWQPGDRVCLHYLATCGRCEYCHRGAEQFCPVGQMLGKQRDGGYAEYIVAPARSLFPLPDAIPFEQGAVMMCSSATALHALRKGRLAAGESVAIFGVGGLGMSAIQLARALGALRIFAVDLDAGRLALAERLGAIPVKAQRTASPSVADEIRRLNRGRGVDVALDFVSLPATLRPAIASLAPFGRVVAVGLGDQPVPIYPYQELINREAEIIGCSDHLASEIPLLTELVRRGSLDLTPVVTELIPLEAAAINATLDRLERYGAGGVRTVIRL
ncbi:MAG TPA: zinc-binding dehydrogenase [Anaerolineae bacterium]|nr:zinc-binding dehydrogenase [Anaerolineae bacterium]